MNELQNVQLTALTRMIIGDVTFGTWHSPSTILWGRAKWVPRPTPLLWWIPNWGQYYYVKRSDLLVTNKRLKWNNKMKSNHNLRRPLIIVLQKHRPQCLRYPVMYRFCFTKSQISNTITPRRSSFSFVHTWIRRVKGVESLRVIDASVMPTLTSGNTHAPSIMIGEKGADIVRGKKLPSMPNH